MSMSTNGRTVRSFATVVVCLFLFPLLASLLPVPFHGPVAPVGASAPAMGDWIVTGPETVSNSDVTLTGNLTVKTGGNLVLDKVNLKMNCNRNGQFNITVKAGGKLTMQNSTVSPIDFQQRYRYNFMIEAGAGASINDSTLSAVGEGDITKIQTMGLSVNASNVKLIHDVFTRINILYPAAGIVVGFMASPLIERNDLTSFLTGISFIMGSHSIVKDNTITNNAIGVLCLLSQPTFKGNDINGNLVGMQFTGSQPTLTGNTFRGSYYNAIAAESSDVVMDSNTFSNNVGDLLFNSSGLIDRHMSITGPGNGIDIDHAGSKQVLIENSTLRATGTSIMTINDSAVQVLNTTFDQNKVKITTNSGSLMVYWFLNVSAATASGGTAPDATITVKDHQNATVFQGPADNDGMVRWVQVEQYLQVGTTRTYRTPHEVTATTGSLWGNATVTMDSSKTLPVVLDDIPPIVKILQPQDGVLFNRSMVSFKGNATDNERVTVVEYKVSSGSWSTATGINPWNFTLKLPEGTVQVAVRATDFHGLQATARVNVSIDSVAPTLMISKPTDGTLTNRTPIQVEGKTDPGASLRLVPSDGGKDKSIPIDANGNFKFSQDLTEGTNSIVLVAQDLAENQATRSVSVVLDTIPPLLYLYSPSATFITNSSKVLISGRTESGGGVTVTVNGLFVVVAQNGTFSYDLLLSDGNYPVRVTARDQAGNQASLLRNVTVKTTRPHIEIDSPANNLLTNTTLISVRGRAQAASVWVGVIEAQTFSASDGWWDFTELYPLKEGQNDLVVKAIDLAGNRDSQTVRVFLDTAPPVLNISEPMDGSDTTSLQINVVGITEAGARLTVNGELVGDTDGSFSVPVNLNMGKNTIIIVARDQAGNSAKVTLTVTREKKGGTTTLGASDLWPLMLVVILLCIAVFLLAYSYARTEPREEGRAGRYKSPKRKVKGGKARKAAAYTTIDEEE